MPPPASPLSDRNALPTPVAVRGALGPEVWALYGRARAGLGGLTLAYAWDDDSGGWSLGIAHAGRTLGGVLLTVAPLMGLAVAPVQHSTEVAALPELHPLAAARLSAAEPTGDTLRVGFPLTGDAEILAFISLVRTLAALAESEGATHDIP
ncbi:MAG: hypothetical protein NTZ05_06865 [Chloroflexi bacterium]|nr:hypothetical protein [Chloroflexota bacterium]